MAINAPEGTRDLLPDEALFWNQFKQTAAEVFGTYGYLPIETPIMEQTELFVRGIGESYGLRTVLLLSRWLHYTP